MELPTNPIRGTRLVWKIPSLSLVRDILCNPFYAGAYVWGRRPVTTLSKAGSRNVWQSDRCAPTLKKMIFRTAIEEIIPRSYKDKRTLDSIIHWKRGAPAQLPMERPRSATETATPMEALEIIRRMAVRHGDDQIASVLNRLGYSTGKGKRWNQTRVATAGATIRLTGKSEQYPILTESV